jgi:plastocyanin
MVERGSVRATYLCLVLVILAGCGSGDTKTPKASGSSGPLTLSYHDESGPGPSDATQERMENIKYLTPAISVKAGKLTVHLVNAEVPPKGAACLGTAVEVCYSHEMKITDQSDKTLAVSATIAPGKDDVFVIDNLPAGTYPFYCSLKDHLARGMKGTITVTA